MGFLDDDVEIRKIICPANAIGVTQRPLPTHRASQRTPSPHT